MVLECEATERPVFVTQIHSGLINCSSWISRHSPHSWVSFKLLALNTNGNNQWNP